jgi:hypothetical protein
MKVEVFSQKLEALGFADTGERLSKENPFVRSYRTPERLAPAVEYLNLGGTRGEAEYFVTFQPPEVGLIDTLGFPVSTDIVVIDATCAYRELGTSISPFCLNADQELLDALTLDAESFLRWLYHRPIAVMEVKEDEDHETYLMRGDSFELLKARPKK